MQADDGVGLLAGREEGIPLAAEDGREAELGRELGETHRLEAPCRVGPHFRRGQRDVLEPGQLEGDDAFGVGSRPRLEVPVVEGAQAGQSELGILSPRVDGTAETRHQRREAQSGPDPGPVHVLNSGLDVEAARPHFVEARRLHAPLVAGAADHGVQADVGVAVALEDPGLGAVVLLDHPGGGVGQGGGQTTLEEIRRLDEVVVDRNDGDPDRPGLGIGQQGGPLRPVDVDGSHEKVTLSSGNFVGPGVQHDHTRRGRRDHGRTRHRWRGRSGRRRAPIP